METYNDLLKLYIASFIKIFENSYSQDTVKIVDDKESISLITPDFVFKIIKLSEEQNYKIDPTKFIYNFESKIFFEVGVSARIACEVTKEITKILDPNYLEVGESYYLNRDKELFYGTEALTEKFKDIQLRGNKKQCPICERFYPSEVIDENGICKICTKSVLPNIIFN